MKIGCGLYKKVFIFKHIVIKVPKINKNILNNIWAVLSCQLCYIICYKEMRSMMIPTYFIPFVPIIIQKRANTDKVVEDDIDYFYSLKKEKYYFLFSDLKVENLGYYKDKLVKIDLDWTFWLYNLMIDIKNKIGGN